MSTPKIFESEYRFCLILWEHEPLPSAELAKLCRERLGWSWTTTYTVIHRLAERGVVKNENGFVSSLVSKTRHRRRNWTNWLKRRLRVRFPHLLQRLRARQSFRRMRLTNCAP